MAVKFVDLFKQYQSIKADIDDAIAGVIGSSSFIGGEFVARFETAFADYQQVEFCVGCANGTDAIEIALEALALPKGGEIIVPANSFIASSEAVTRAGYQVVFCDCDPADFTVTAETISAKLTPKTVAIVVVHLYGQPCDMNPIMALAAARGLKVIEDCAQAHGAEYRGRRVGGIGDVGTFSFYPGKNLGAFGDGGAIVTKDRALAVRARMIANHGRVAKYDHEFEGRNSRLDGMQAAILSAKLRHLEGWIAQRQSIAQIYDDQLSDVGDLILAPMRGWSRHVHHLYVVRTRYRDSLQSYLKERHIESGIHYPIALPKLKAYAYLGQAEEKLFANRLGEELLSLPIGEHMTPENVSEVISACREFFTHVSRSNIDSSAREMRHVG